MAQNLASIKTDVLLSLVAAIQDAQQSYLFEATRDDTKRYLVMASSNTTNLVQRIIGGGVWHYREIDERFTNLAYWIRCAKEEGERAHPAQSAQ